MPTQKICTNSRILLSPTTGVQRYLLEILKRSGDRIEKIQPTSEKFKGFKGHLWEQFVLPFRCKSKLLWSPSGTGPIFTSNQVVTIHDLSPLDHPEWFSSKYAKWYQSVIPQVAKKARHIITDSEYSKTRIIEICKMPPEKVTVIPLGVDEKFFKEIDHANLGVLNLPSEKYILTLGSVEPRKNLKTLLQAWEKILPKLPSDVWLVITGEKGNSRIFSSTGIETENLPRVHFTGRVPDSLLPSLYSNSMAFVYPSFYEGFGLPPLEAMAAGAPVVTSNATSLPEVVGDCGLLFNPHSSDELSNSLERMIHDQELRTMLSAKGRERARQFDWNTTAQKTLAILERFS